MELTIYCNQQDTPLHSICAIDGLVPFPIVSPWILLLLTFMHPALTSISI